MGGPIVENLLRNGYTVIVHDIDANVVAPLLKQGARNAASALEVGATANIVGLCLPSVKSLKQAALGDNGVAQGGVQAKGSGVRICINFSTVGPDCAEELGAGLAPHKITLLDCPITGGIIPAREGKLSMTVSGEKAAFDEVRTVLDCLAAHVFHVGERPGQAQLMKLLNNMLAFTAFVATCEAFVLGVKAGLDPDTMVDVINTGTGRNSATTDKMPRNVLPRTFDYGAKLYITYKDILLCMEQAQRHNVPMWVGNMVKQVIELGVFQEGDQVDVSTLIKQYEKWGGVVVKGRAAKD